MIINHKKLNQTPKKIYEIVPHAMHCGGGYGKRPHLFPFFCTLPYTIFCMSPNYFQCPCKELLPELTNDTSTRSGPLLTSSLLVAYK